MSSGADGSAPGPALDPTPGPELNREPPVLQAPEPAPQQEMAALQMEAPAPQQEAVALQMETPGPAPQQEVVALQMEALAPAPQQEVVALQTEAPMPAVTIVISRPGDELHAPDAKGVSPASSPQAGGGKATAASVSVTAAVAAKEAELARSDSFDDYEQCRVCQQKTEEPLVDLGCRCRGDLAKAHRTCINVWFRTRGSNKCEICQQLAVNIPPPETQASTSYWVWRVDSTYGRGRGGRERGWFSPLWVAFAILIGGLLLDVLISVSLGVSALPVNIIIGVLIVLGLGTALRLALECCQEWGSRRNVSNMPRMENIPPTGYHPAVV
ncbi:E3 ubiquitin-protein ligase MARCHF11-like isoform X2 [Panicum virgatum]|uniref:E3 ubiquitin-protein ligase MARCHF11-like isoform X2 n=1 Tax=Panicum virgatum TaxID=38727 RepID=UPI0019D559A0|nr:E3 ubiquitin-protein ligase MARCHF11-like isoform X2 [Panicum virgatum]